jgi:prephenate dehydratase
MKLSMPSEAAEVVVAFQGEPGAYSEQAALEYLGDGIVTLPCHAFEDVFQAVSSRRATNGMLPIENSLAGSIHRNYDLLLRNDLHIVGEYFLRVSHCLLALPGAKLEEIRRVYSHPQALAQCESNLRRLQLEPIVAADTAGSARELHDSGDRHSAALASRRAAQVYGLEILYEHVEDNPANYTRFLSLACQAFQIGAPEQEHYKTSIVFALKNQPGVLFKALSVFALRDIDLTKIESRPIPGKPWEYLFYIDFIGHADSGSCQRALDHLGEFATFLRLLGSYPRDVSKFLEN